MMDILERIERATSGEFAEDYAANDLVRLLSDAGDAIRRLEADVTLADAQISEMQRLRSELNALDKALRCHGWPLEARLARAEMLAELAVRR